MILPGKSVQNFPIDVLFTDALSHFTVSWDLVGNREKSHDSMEPIRCSHEYDSVKCFHFAVESFPVSTIFDFESLKTGEGIYALGTY